MVDFNPTLLTYTGFVTSAGVTLFQTPLVSTVGNTRTVRLGFENAEDFSTVGTFSFTAIGKSGSLATLGLQDGDSFFGSFASYLPTLKPFSPTFSGAQVGIAAVPLPGSLWLLGTGVLGLLHRLRSRRVRA